MTRIQKVVKRQYYLKTQYRNSTTGEPKTKYKRRYDRVVYLVQFPKGLDVTDLLGKELVFEKRGDVISIRPRLSSPQLNATHPV